MSGVGWILHPGADVIDEDTVDDPKLDDAAWDERVPFALTDEGELLASLDDQVHALGEAVPITMFAAQTHAPMLPPPIDEGRFVGTSSSPAVLFLVGPAAGDAS